MLVFLDFDGVLRREPGPQLYRLDAPLVQRFQATLQFCKVLGDLVPLEGDVIASRAIDRIDDLGNGAVAIVDYKTGKPRAQEDADESLQLSIYAIAAQEKWGYRAERLVFYNLEENTAITTGRHRIQLDEARAKIADVADRIAALQFDAKPGYHCRFCPYRNLCPATEKPVYATPPAKKAATN